MKAHTGRQDNASDHAALACVRTQDSGQWETSSTTTSPSGFAATTTKHCAAPTSLLARAGSLA
eukprot:10160977-Heterocapsa_arctica.AAC.1